jgi:hypothetical protein
MCDPSTALLATSAIVTAAGAGASIYGQEKQRQAYDTVNNNQANAIRQANQNAMALQSAERSRQQGYQAQSQGLLNQSVQNASLENQQAQEATQKNALTGQYSNAAQAATALPTNIPGLLQGDSQGPQVVKDAYANTMGSVGNYLGQQAGAKAALDAFGNQNAANTMYNARQLQQQGVLGNFMQGSTSALANELAANGENSGLSLSKAQMSGNGLASQAAIANGLGGLGLNLGISGLTAGVGRLNGANQAPKITGYGVNGAQYTSTPYFTPVKLN